MLATMSHKKSHRRPGRCFRRNSPEVRLGHGNNRGSSDGSDNLDTSAIVTPSVSETSARGENEK